MVQRNKNGGIWIVGVLKRELKSSSACSKAPRNPDNKKTKKSHFTLSFVRYESIVSVMFYICSSQGFR